MKTSRPSYQDNMLAFHFSTTDMIHVSYHVQITLTLHELQIFLTSRETAGRSALDEVLISIRQTGKQANIKKHLGNTKTGSTITEQKTGPEMPQEPKKHTNNNLSDNNTTVTLLDSRLFSRQTFWCVTAGEAQVGPVTFTMARFY